MYDVIIVGGGPAGLSAATILGRCRRSVLVCDDGQYRNDASRGVHGFLTRDGIHPAELRRIGREQSARYGIEYRQARVTDARPRSEGFEVVLEPGDRLACRRLLLATGVIDTVPDIPGMRDFFGCGVFHCQYCDGWEVRDQPLAAYGNGKSVAGLALSLLTWSADVVVCTDGAARIPAAEAAALEAHGVTLRTERIARVEGSESGLERIVFRGGEELPRRALFLSAGQSQRCDLASRLGCRFTDKGAVRTGKMEGTNVPGLFVAGDASKDVQLAIVAAAEGAKAALAINQSLEVSSK